MNRLLFTAILIAAAAPALAENNRYNGYSSERAQLMFDPTPVAQQQVPANARQWNEAAGIKIENGRIIDGEGDAK